MIELHKITTENITNKFDTIGNLPINLFDKIMMKSINIIEPINEKNTFKNGFSFLSTISFKLATSNSPFYLYFKQFQLNYQFII